jgi:hypothetical protein
LPSEEQPVDPYGTVTRKAAADLMIRREMNEGGALHAYDLDPWHLAGESGLGRFPKEPRARRFLRHYLLAGLPEDPKLRERAAAFLRRQGKQDLAQKASDSFKAGQTYWIPWPFPICVAPNPESSVKWPRVTRRLGEGLKVALPPGLGLHPLREVTTKPN